MDQETIDCLKDTCIVKLSVQEIMDLKTCIQLALHMEHRITDFDVRMQDVVTRLQERLEYFWNYEEPVKSPR